MAKVPSRFGDIVKHVLRRSLKPDPKKRAAVGEIEDVLIQRLLILDAQNKEFEKKEEPEDNLKEVRSGASAVTPSPFLKSRASLVAGFSEGPACPRQEGEGG